MRCDQSAIGKSGTETVLEFCERDGQEIAPKGPGSTIVVAVLKKYVDMRLLVEGKIGDEAAAIGTPEAVFES